LAKKGDYEAALAKHVWFHENAVKVDPSYYGVRLSFALAHWVELGGKYPKALEKLRTIRDGNSSRILAGEVNRDLFHDVVSINRYLGESSRTVELFRGIDAANAKFASDLYDLADEALVDSREYDLTKKYLGDPMRRLGVAKRNYDEGKSFADRKSGDATLRAFEANYTDEVVRIITVLRETKDHAGAKTVRDEALKTLDSSAIKNTLKE
jgi:hypothetical protein